jgi:hypothetical protein
MLEVKENQMIHLKWIYPLKMVIFYSYVKLPEGRFSRQTVTGAKDVPPESHL